MSLSRIADGQSRDVYDFDNVTHESVHETCHPPDSDLPFTHEISVEISDQR